MILTQKKIMELLPKCDSRKELLSKLGLKYNGGTRRTLRIFCMSHGIDLTVFDIKLTKEKYEANPKHCRHCGKVIPYAKRENDFCDSSCAASFTNKGKVKTFETRKKISETLQKRNPKHHDKIKQIVKQEIHEKRFCKNCGKELLTSQESFCCNKCQKLYYRKQYIERWKNGEEIGLKGKYGVSSHIRHYLLEKHNYCCEKCGWGEINQYTGKYPLEVHHIDGDYTNNKEENLQLLCPNCHSLTETYKAHNKKGRKGRDKYNL